MKSEIIEIFDWFDIQSEICKEMGIDEKYFRDYHKLVGGDYKDLWHEWMNFFQCDLRNDTIVQNDLGESMESKMAWITEKNKDWMKPFVESVYKVWNNHNIMYVRYCW